MGRFSVFQNALNQIRSYAQQLGKGRGTTAPPPKPERHAATSRQGPTGNQTRARAQADRMKQELQDNGMAVKGQEAKTPNAPSQTGAASSSSNDSWNPSGPAPGSPSNSQSRGIEL